MPSELQFDLGKYTIWVNPQRINFEVEAYLKGTTLRSYVTNVNGIQGELLQGIQTKDRERMFEQPSSWTLKDHGEFMRVLSNAVALFSGDTTCVVKALDLDREEGEWKGDPNDPATRLVLNTGHTKEEWATEMASRLMSEWTNAPQCDPEQLEHIQQAIERALANTPLSVEQLIGTMLIEEHYFEEIS